MYMLYSTISYTQMCQQISTFILPLRLARSMPGLTVSVGLAGSTILSGVQCGNVTGLIFRSEI